jgi:hypothetical protein
MMPMRLHVISQVCGACATTTSGVMIVTLPVLVALPVHVDVGCVLLCSAGRLASRPGGGPAGVPGVCYGRCIGRHQGHGTSAVLAVCVSATFAPMP